MIVLAIPLRSASLGLWVALQKTPFSLRQTFRPSLANCSNAASSSNAKIRPPAHEPPAVEQRANAMEQVQADGCTNNVVVEKVCDIGTDERLPARRSATMSFGLSKAHA